MGVFRFLLPCFCLSVVSGRVSDYFQRLRNFHCDQLEENIELSSDLQVLILNTIIVDENKEICWNITTEKNWKIRFEIMEMNLDHCMFDCRQCHFIEFYSKSRSLLPRKELSRIHNRQCFKTKQMFPFSYTSSENKALIRFHLDRHWKVGGGSTQIQISKVKSKHDDRDDQNCDPKQPIVVDVDKYPTGTIQNYVKSNGKYRLDERCRWYFKVKDPYKVIRFKVLKLQLPGSCPIAQKWETCDKFCFEQGNHVTIWDKRGEIDNGTVLFRGCSIFTPKERFHTCSNEATIEFVTGNRYESNQTSFSGFIIEYTGLFKPTLKPILSFFLR